MGKEHLISVLITTYNANATIKETLNSIAKQTYNNYEIIIVDDGSKDNTLNIIKDWQKNHVNITFRLFKPGRLGRSNALNFGVKQAKGEWIAICDADDLWHPMKLELQIKAISGDNIDVLSTDYKSFSVNQESGRNAIIRSKVGDKDIFHITMDDLLKRNLIFHSSVLIRKGLCQYNGELEKMIDFECWLRLVDQGYNN